MPSILVRFDDLTVWNGETLSGWRHPLNIADLWTEEELMGIGLAKPAPFVVPDGKRPLGAPRYEKEGGRVITVYDLEDIPGPSSADVDTEMTRRLAGGVAFQGHVFQLDQESQQNITSVGAAAKFAMASGAEEGFYRWADPGNDFVWIAADNQQVPMDAPTMSAFADAAMLYVIRLRMAARGLKDLAAIPADYTDDGYWPA